MKENTNRTIAINSAIMYARMGITAICAILTTRYALQALGVSDFGLFSLLGGIIAMILVLNTIMLSSTNRFIAVALGKGDEIEVNKQFNVNWLIHLVLAALTALIAIPVGLWYIDGYVNYDGDMNNAIIVFILSIIGSIISFIGVPYNGLLMAKEKFIVFCLVDVISHIAKLIVAIVLTRHFLDKLLIYAATQSILTALPTLVYVLYCKHHYSEITHLAIVRDVRRYKEVLGFSGWVGFGAVATIAKNQGAAIVINHFFSTILNTALGIANSIIVYIQMFAQNIANPIAPQLTKSYAAGDMDRCNKLFVLSTKLTFLIMLVVSTPFITHCDWILSKWLGDYPADATVFLKLLIVDNLIASLYSSATNLVFASGKLSLFQFVTNCLKLLSIVVAYILLDQGLNVTLLLYTYIVFSIFSLIGSLLILRYHIGYGIRPLIKYAYIPSAVVLILVLPLMLIRINIHPLIFISISLVYEAIVIFYFGLNKTERVMLLKIIKR